MPKSKQPADALVRDFVSFNQDLAAGGTRPAALQRLVEHAVIAIDGCDWAGITEWPVKTGPHTIAYAGDVARAVDQLQYSTRQGPCLNAAEDAHAPASPVASGERQPIDVPDLDAETRWPQFVQATLTQTPVRAILSFPLVGQPVRSALNLYSARPGDFDDATADRAELFVEHARTLMLHASSRDKACNLDIALTSSRQIGTAIGILMQAHKITNDQAFTLLRATSQHLNRKLRDVADDVIQTGELPATA